MRELRFYDAREVIYNDSPFCFIIGGRGIGKTYSCLWEMCKTRTPHIYLRNQQNEIDLCCNETINPYKSVNRDKGFDYHIERKKDFALIKENDQFRGYAFALSTFGKLRGADFSEIDVVIRDEFIKTTQEYKKEADDFFNFYETVSRNREANGNRKVLKTISLSNSVSIASPLLRELGLIGVLETMLRKNQRKYTDKERGIFINLPWDADFAEFKGETALYKLTKGTKYYQHAVNNKFVYDSWYNVKKCNLIEYRPYVSVLGITIYKHKSNSTYYASTVRGDCPTFDEDTLALFHRNYYLSLREVNIAGKLFYESYAVKSVINGLIT